MNIVLHIPSLGSGGAERQLALLAKGLAGKLESVHVVTFYSGGVFWDELEKDPRIRLHSLNRKNRWDFFVVKQLVDYCEENNIHLIQAFLAPSSVIASLSSKKNHIPLVIGIRSSDMKFQFGARIYKFAERVLGNLFAAKYISNSHAGMQYNCSIGYKRHLMSVIPNGLDAPVRDCVPPFQNNDVIRLGMIGRLGPVKDIPVMLQAFSLLHEKVGQVELWMYGDGDDDYKQKLFDMCVALNIEASVCWKGWVSSVWDALDEIDILVSSSYSEGMSNTLMEGLAWKRVVVSTDVGDARVLLEGVHGKTGYLVPPSNPQDLSDILAYAIENLDESLMYAERGQALIGQQYSIAAMVDSYDKLYKEISN